MSRVRHSVEFQQQTGSLLRFCSSRLIRYELLDPLSQDPVLQFLTIDFESIPERHSFLGNYRRFCIMVIERIVRRNPFEALGYILAQSEELLASVSRHAHPASANGFKTDSHDQLIVEAQCTVTQTAVKSYMHW